MPLPVVAPWGRAGAQRTFQVGMVLGEVEGCSPGRGGESPRSGRGQGTKTARGRPRPVNAAP